MGVFWSKMDLHIHCLVSPLRFISGQVSEGLGEKRSMGWGGWQRVFSRLCDQVMSSLLCDFAAVLFPIPIPHPYSRLKTIILRITFKVCSPCFHHVYI